MAILAWIGAGVALLAALLFLPPLLGALPKRPGGGVGAALSELNGLTNPAERHAQVARIASDVPERKRAQPPALDGLCIRLRVRDPDRSLAFYRDLLGFEVAAGRDAADAADADADAEGLALVRRDLRLVLTPTDPQAPGQVTDHRAGHRDVGLEFTCADLEGAYAALSALGPAFGLTLARPTSAAGGLSFADPDGYEIRLRPTTV